MMIGRRRRRRRRRRKGDDPVCFVLLRTIIISFPILMEDGE